MAASANVTVTFSEAMAAATISTSTLELRDSGGAAMAAAVSYNAATHTATIDPSSNLTPAAAYTVLVRGGAADPRVKDLAGNALAADATWSFTVAPLSLSIGDAAVTEGNSGVVNASFIVTLSAASSQTVSVTYATGGGTATPGSDYTAVPATGLTFDPGQVSKTVVVAVVGDTASEGNETFFVNLSSPVNAVLGDSQGQGTINDDDGLPIGSEGFGYSASTHLFESVDLVPGAAGVFTIRTTGNNNSDLVTLTAGNSFNFYGTSYTSFFVSTNGLITFGTGNTAAANTNLTSSPTQRVIAPLWDDWVNVSGQTMLLGKYEDTSGDGTPDRLILEWNNVQGNPSSPSSVAFQAILQLNTAARPGEFTFNYPDLNAGNAASNGASATVGIKDSGTQGARRLLVSFNAANTNIGSGKAIRFKPDSTAPTVSLTAPAAGATVSGTVTLTASASDNIGVSGVQFFLDGSPLGAEDTAAPYSVVWNTETAANGSHTLTARARDTSGNLADSAPVSVTVAPDFSFTVLNPTRTLATTGNTFYEVEVAYLNGFTSSSVDLWFENLPAGVTADFAFDPMSHQGRTELFVSATNAAPGTYTLTVGATAEGIAHSQPITLVVTTAADFGVSVSPSVQTVRVGDSISFSVSLTETNDFTDPVALSVPNLPAGLTATFGTPSAVPVATTTLTLTASTSATPGTYTLNVTGTSGALTRSAPITVTVDPSTAAWTVQTMGSTGVPNNTVRVGALKEDGKERVYIGTIQTGRMLEYTWTGSAWTGPVDVGGSPTGHEIHDVTIGPGRGDGQDRIYAASYDFNIYEIWFDGTSWRQLTVGTLDNLGMHAAVGVGRNDGVTRVYAASTQTLYEFTWNGSSWTRVTIGSTPGAHNVAVGNARGDGTNRVYVGSISSGTFEASFNGTNWTIASLGDSGDVRAVGLGPGRNDGVTRVYSSLLDGRMREFTWNGSSWTIAHSQTVAGAQLIHAYVLPGRNDGVQRVYASSSNGKVYEFTWNGSGWTIVNMGGGTDYMYGLHYGAGRNDGQTRLYGADRGAVNRVYEYTWTAPDTTAPSVALTAPDSGATVSGTVTISASASDNVGVAGVQFLLNGASLGAEDTSSPYAFAWDTTTAANGNYTLSARARDLAGNLATSATRTVTVGNVGDTEPPTGPTNLAATGGLGTAFLTWTASTDNVGVTGYNVHRSTTANFTATPANLVGQTAATSFSNTGLAAGTYYYRVVARDAAGNLSLASDEASVVVTADTEAPTVAITAPSDGATVSGSVTVSATASDNVAVVGVQFFLDGNLLGGEDTAAPYSLVWNTGTVANGSHTLTARARDAAGNIATSAAITVLVVLAGNPIVTENQLPGSPASEWDVSGAGDSTLQGFATDISVDQGQTVSFKINDTSLAPYRLDIYRMGYYGGLGARKVATIPSSQTLRQVQPSPLSNASTGLIDAGNWAVSASWAVPATATSGIYFARAVREDTGGASHIFFIVRDDDGRSDLLFQTADTTWQAYNSWGGNSLYVGSPAGRAYKVSYNRPFNTRAVAPEDWVFNAEYPMVRWLEANGYNVSYFTDVDSDRRGAELLEHKLFLSVGHDEYWSAGQWANVEAARNAGVHLAFFSGNEVFWKTRWENSIDGSGTAYRTLVCYKETHANAKIDPSPVWTGTWRDPRFSPPADGGRPENALTGTIFMVNAGATTAIQVPAADGKMRFWRNTSVATLSAGQTATLSANTLGYEWDVDLDNGFRPAGLFRLSTTTVNNAPVLLDHGSTYGSGPATHHLTLYRHASGALVFGAGTVQWSWGLDGNHDRGGSTPDVRMRQATVNLFADMGAQPGSLQPGLVGAAASTDATAPTTTITSPTNGATLQPGIAVTITGTASDAGGGVVGGVEVSTDGGATWHPAAGRASWSYSWTPSTTGTVTIRSRAVDDSSNIQGTPVSVTVTVGGQQGGGLVAAYGFNEGASTTAADASGRGNAGAVSGATWAAGGKYGGALSFDGVNDWVTVADASSLDLTTAMTLEAWVRPSTINGWETVLMKEASGNYTYGLYADDNGNDAGQPRRPGVWVVQGGSYFGAQGTSQLPVNAWTHLAATYDGTALRLYVNGTQAGSLNRSGSINVSSGPLRIGGNSIWSEWFNGLIDEVRVYSRVLTQAEIQSDMNTPVGSPLRLLGEAVAAGDAAPLSQHESRPLFDEAVTRWSVALDDAEAARRLAGVRVEVMDLPGTTLGLASATVIYLDSNGAGDGWFLDLTPWEDSEYAHGLAAIHVTGRIDLLTVLAHEMGHILGLEDDAAADPFTGSVMAEVLPLGVRRIHLEGLLPAAREGAAPVGRAATALRRLLTPDRDSQWVLFAQDGVIVPGARDPGWPAAGGGYRPRDAEAVGDTPALTEHPAIPIGPRGGALTAQLAETSGKVFRRGWSVGAGFELLEDNDPDGSGITGEHRPRIFDHRNRAG